MEEGEFSRSIEVELDAAFFTGYSAVINEFDTIRYKVARLRARLHMFVLSPTPITECPSAAHVPDCSYEY